jgi:hypothetical protein
MTRLVIDFNNVFDPVELRRVSELLSNLAHTMEPSEVIKDRPAGLTHPQQGVYQGQAEKQNFAGTSFEIPGDVTAATNVVMLNQPQQGNGVEVDKNNIPWDGRIHAATRARNADQTWRYRRGVDPVTIKQVESELAAVMGGGLPSKPFTNQQAIPEPPIVGNVVATVPAPPNTSTALPAGTIGQVSGAAQNASPSDSQSQFQKLMHFITSGYRDKTLDPQLVGAAVEGAGIPNLPALLHRPDLVEFVATSLGCAL